MSRAGRAVIAGVMGGLLLILLLILLPDPWLFKASEVEVFAMAVPATAFPILYSAFFPWWKSPLGRALMTKATGLCLLIDASVLYAVFGDDYPLREQVRFLTFSLVLIGMCYQSLVIIKIKVQAKRKAREGQAKVEMV